METLAIIILGILLTLAILLIVRLITNVHLWRESYFLKEESYEMQSRTIENQKVTIENYKIIIQNYQAIANIKTIKFEFDNTILLN